jgi:hypothetical protein
LTTDDLIDNSISSDEEVELSLNKSMHVPQLNKSLLHENWLHDFQE